MQQFSNKTLNANWYEERLAREQLYRQKPDLRNVRERENDLNCLTSSGLPKPLGTISRLPKHDTTGIIPDDGFRELVTTKQTHMVNPQVHKVKEKPVMRMINKYNIAELSLVDRPIGGAQAGFGAVINRYPVNHDQRHFDTTMGDFMGKPAPKSEDPMDPSKSYQAGGNHRPFEKHLPLGDGVWSVQPKSDEVGFYRKRRTDVTIQKNNVITRR